MTYVKCLSMSEIEYSFLTNEYIFKAKTKASQNVFILYLELPCRNMKNVNNLVQEMSLSSYVGSQF